jgi:hypothetical protein
MSPYAQSLVDQINQAQTELDAAKAEVMLACYWARIGNLAEAEEIRAASRRRFPSGHYGELTVLHMCLDGLIYYFSEQSPSAAERLRGAHALATTYRFRREQSFSGAWLAHIEFNRDRWEAMAQALDSCHAAMDLSDRAVVGRFALVIADALSHAGLATQSRDWYSHARKQLTSIGDHAAIEAYLYNGAALRLHAARLSAIAGTVTKDDLRTLGGEIASATNYQRMTEQRSLDYLLDLATASHRLLSMDLSGARALLVSLLAPNVLPKGSSALPLILSDVALCNSLAQVSASEAQDSVKAARTAVHPDMAPDDLALAAHSLALATEALGDAADAANWRQYRDQALSSFEESRAKLRQALSKWAVDPVLVFESTRS